MVHSTNLDFKIQLRTLGLKYGQYPECSKHRDRGDQGLASGVAPRGRQETLTTFWVFSAQSRGTFGPAWRVRGGLVSVSRIR